MTRTQRSESTGPTPEIVAVVGQRAGVGATTTAVNLARGLAAAGRSVLLLDLDPEGGASRAMGVAGRERGGTERVLRERAVTRDMIAPPRSRSSIWPRPAPSWRHSTQIPVRTRIR